MEPIAIPEDIPTNRRKSYFLGARARRQGKKIRAGANEYWIRGYQEHRKITMPGIQSMPGARRKMPWLK